MKLQSDIAFTRINARQFQTENWLAPAFWRKSKYWVFSDDCSIWASDKNGSRKAEQAYRKRNLFKSQCVRENGDSTEYTQHYFITNQDTVCFFAYKKVFRQSLLLEVWQKYVPMDGIDFENGKSAIQKFTYTGNKISRIDHYRADSIGKVHQSPHYSLITYNTDGQIMTELSYLVSKPDIPYHAVVYTYQNKQLIRVESYTENRLTELKDIVPVH